jgi:hypothetical protein
MKILFLCQLMSPLLLTRRNWSPLQAFAPSSSCWTHKQGAARFRVNAAMRPLERAQGKNPFGFSP